MELMNSLIEQIRKERVVLFLGSGFSADAGAPRSSDICNALLSHLTDEEKKSLNGNQLDYVANEFEQMQGRDTLMQVLKKAFTFQTKNLYNQHALTQIPHFHTIITTNYDTLLEDTYGNDCVVVRSAQDCTDLPNDKVKIYKIHGDFGNTNDMVVTSDDYIRYFTQNRDNSLWKHIQSLLLTKDVLFIGYSLEDKNLYEILKNIQSDTNRCKENNYLIVPDLSPRKIKRIEEVNIKYINSRAEVFLPTLIQSINKHICKDFRKKRVSTETATKYCELHHIQLTVKVKSTENTIEKIETIGKSNEVKLQISTCRSDIANAIAHKNFSLFTDVLPSDSPIKCVPALQIPSQDMKDASIEINGITVFEKDDLKAIYVLPLSKNISKTVRIPAIGFNEKVSVQAYGDGQTVHFTLQTAIYNLTATLLSNDNNVDYYDLKFNITFTDKYENNAEALKWIGFLMALFGGEKVYIENRKEPACGKKDAASVEYFKKRQQYYLNISEIEKLTECVFDEYDNYSERNYTHSEIVLCYLKRRPWVKSTPDGTDFSCYYKNHSSNELPQAQGQYCILLPQQPNQDFIVNGKAFNIPYQNVFMRNCSLVSVVENEKDNMTQLNFHNNETETLFYFSDRPARLDGDTVNLL